MELRKKVLNSMHVMESSVQVPLLGYRAGVTARIIKELKVLGWKVSRARGSQTDPCDELVITLPEGQA